MLRYLRLAGLAGCLWLGGCAVGLTPDGTPVVGPKIGGPSGADLEDIADAAGTAAEFLPAPFGEIVKVLAGGAGALGLWLAGDRRRAREEFEKRAALDRAYDEGAIRGANGDRGPVGVPSQAPGGVV